MERFGYTLQQVKEESTELLYLLECASYGKQQDDMEKLEQQEAEWEQKRIEMETANGE